MPTPADLSRAWVSGPGVEGVQVHAPSVLATGAGLLVAWFAGRHEGSPDTRIRLAAGTGGRWQESRVVAEADDAHWNPVLCRGVDDRIWLFLKRGAAISSWVTWATASADGGRSWHEPWQLVPGEAGVGGRGPVKNPPLQVGGAWLAPGSTEIWGRPPRWEPFIDRSDDAGATWRRIPIPVDRTSLRGAGLIQPALWRTESTGRVNALMRSTEGVAYRSWSDDDGATWAPAQPTTLANNNSALCVQALPSGRVACVHNPVSDDWGARCPLVVSVSEDGGATWRTAAIVEDGKSPIDSDPASVPTLPTSGDAPVGTDTGVRTDGRGEYSYPSACIDEEDLVVCYTWQRRRIAQARIPLGHLEPSTEVEEGRR